MKAVAIIQQSCSDSLAIANPTDRVFGTDSGLLAAFFFAMNALVGLQGTRSAGRITRIPALVYYAAQFLLARARPVASSRILQSWEGPS
jgi:hypothetical protein